MSARIQPCVALTEGGGGGGMSVTPYATVDDLHAILGSTPPADSQRLLARAQELVDAALTSAMYTTDTNGNATDATVLAAMNKATCFQVQSWIASGDELNEMGQWSSFTIEGISASRGSGVGSRRYRLCDEAWDALRAAKLVPGTVFPT